MLFSTQTWTWTMPMFSWDIVMIREERRSFQNRLHPNCIVCRNYFFPYVNSATSIDTNSHATSENGTENLSHMQLAASCHACRHTNALVKLSLPGPPTGCVIKPQTAPCETYMSPTLLPTTNLKSNNPTFVIATRSIWSCLFSRIYLL